MSIDGPERLPGVFCDTSVLLRYVLGQGDTAAQELLIEKENSKIISPKVKEEFEIVPERKEEIYLDFMELLTSEDRSIAEAKAEDRDYLKTNDVDFFKSLRDEIASKDDKRAKLKTLREKQKIIDQRWGRVSALVEDTKEQNDDLGLILKLGRIVDNEDDVQVICDAARWSDNGGSGLFCTLDYHDIINNRDEIREAILDYDENCDSLKIGDPSGILSRLDDQDDP
ncbi:hypothetical protein [Haloarchaeobius sp. HME9146]|uniref:hypothetical protein n=1 Tax=Haloarchaeobius sp. HME9146 TaxID=2978732 RepID=UPI0021C0EEC1|nr:hypothetical protein [Haloarchaeobius sp. HME9146]MCT9095353.1 hypothetical protein [Haloarchaeobius sp. HME9146]